MREVEEQSRSWGYREQMLEVRGRAATAKPPSSASSGVRRVRLRPCPWPTQVACCNLEAMSFYQKLGYRIVRSDVSGTGATIVENNGFFWRVLPVEKYIMRRSI